MKKYIISAIAVMATIASANAQSFKVVTTAGDEFGYNTEDVESITFSDESLPKPEVELSFSEYMTNIQPPVGTIDLGQYYSGLTSISIQLSGNFVANTDCTEKITLTGPDVSVEIGVEDAQTKYYAYYREDVNATMVSLYISDWQHQITAQGDYTLTIPKGFFITNVEEGEGEILGGATFEYTIPEPAPTVVPFSSVLESMTPADGIVDVKVVETGVDPVTLVLKGVITRNINCNAYITITKDERELVENETITAGESNTTIELKNYAFTTEPGVYYLSIPEGYFQNEAGELIGAATKAFVIQEPEPAIEIGNITVNAFPTYASIVVAGDQLTTEGLGDATVSLSYKLNDGQYSAMSYNEGRDQYYADVQFQTLQPGTYTVTVKAEAVLNGETILEAEKEAADKFTYTPTPNPSFVSTPMLSNATITATSATFPVKYIVEYGEYAPEGAKLYIVATNTENSLQVTKQEIEIATTTTEVNLEIKDLEASTEYTYGVQLRLENAEGNPIVVVPGNAAQAPTVTFTTAEPAPSLPDPEVGMYYYSDGTWGADKTDEAIGMIFYVGAGPGDSADNYPMLNEIHGYVVALEDASSMAQWDQMPQMLMDLIGISTSTSDFIGYKNTQQLKEFAGQPFDQFPAAYAAVNYKVEAPATSSGWYLPSAAEMNELFEKHNNTVDGKDYWTSTEHSGTAAYYLYASGWFGGGIVGSENKNTPHAVKSVLAF